MKIGLSPTSYWYEIINNSSQLCVSKLRLNGMLGRLKAETKQCFKENIISVITAEYDNLGLASSGSRVEIKKSQIILNFLFL